jgi:hypothetical protein
MRWTETLQGVRVIKFRDILSRYESSEFNQMEAAEGVSERTFRRYSGLTARHFHAHPVRDHKFAWGCTGPKTPANRRGWRNVPSGAARIVVRVLAARCQA